MGIPLLIIMILIAVISVVAATVSIFSIVMYIIKNDILYGIIMMK